MTLLCRCMEKDCPNPHFDPEKDRATEFNNEFNDVIAEQDEAEDKTWPPKTIETK